MADYRDELFAFAKRKLPRLKGTTQIGFYADPRLQKVTGVAFYEIAPDVAQKVRAAEVFLGRMLEGDEKTLAISLAYNGYDAGSFFAELGYEGLLLQYGINTNNPRHKTNKIPAITVEKTRSSQRNQPKPKEVKTYVDLPGLESPVKKDLTNIAKWNLLSLSRCLPSCLPRQYNPKPRLP